MAFAVEYKLCVGSLAVPLVSEVLLLDGDEAEAPVFELDLTSATADFHWAEAALGLRRRSFRLAKWPLLEDFKKLVTDHRSSLGKRAAKRPHVGVAGAIRGAPVLVRNSTKAVRVCFRRGEEASGIQWLLAELRKDLPSLQDSVKVDPGWRSQNLPATNSRAALAGAGEPADPVAKIREQTLSRLRSLSAVRAAYFSEARAQLLVTGTCGKKVQVTVRGLKRLRSGLGDDSAPATEQALAEAFQEAFEETERRLAPEEPAPLADGENGSDSGAGEAVAEVAGMGS
jgi:hypothetical protein